jgi:hypothetical protein
LHVGPVATVSEAASVLCPDAVSAAWSLPWTAGIRAAPSIARASV